MILFKSLIFIIVQVILFSLYIYICHHNSVTNLNINIESTISKRNRTRFKQNIIFRFLRNPTELKNIKNISQLRQQMRIKSEPEEEGGSGVEPEIDMPTDLSMSSMSQPSSEQQQQQQPLSLLDPPVKYRSHAYNLVKTNQESEEQK